MSRSSKKGPWVEERLMSRIEALNAQNTKQMVRTWSRASTIVPEMASVPEACCAQPGRCNKERSKAARIRALLQPGLGKILDT